MSASLNGNMRKAIWSLMVAAIVGLAGWIAHTTRAVAALEVRAEETKEDIREIKEAVKSIHETFIGPMPSKPRP